MSNAVATLTASLAPRARAGFADTVESIRRRYPDATPKIIDAAAASITSDRYGWTTDADAEAALEIAVVRELLRRPNPRFGAEILIVDAVRYERDSIGKTAVYEWDWQRTHPALSRGVAWGEMHAVHVNRDAGTLPGVWCFVAWRDVDGTHRAKVARVSPAQRRMLEAAGVDVRGLAHVDDVDGYGATYDIEATIGAAILDAAE